MKYEHLQIKERRKGYTVEFNEGLRCTIIDKQEISSSKDLYRLKVLLVNGTSAEQVDLILDHTQKKVVGTSQKGLGRTLIPQELDFIVAIASSCINDKLI